MARPIILLLPLAASFAGPASAAAVDEDAAIAANLAAMLRAGRAVVSANQDRINDPAKGQDGLDGPGFLAQVMAQFKQATGKDPADIDPATRGGRLMHMEMDAIVEVIVEVIDENQPTFMAPGPTFKGFIPAFFARLVGEAFGRRAGGEAEMKVTAPPDLVRNRKARPDPWELQTITTRFESADCPAMLAVLMASSASIPSQAVAMPKVCPWRCRRRTSRSRLSGPSSTTSRRDGGCGTGEAMDLSTGSYRLHAKSIAGMQPTDRIGPS
jgi:hypothetical protein